MAGMLICAAGLVLAPTGPTTTGYPRLGVAMVLLEAGLVLSSAPPSGERPARSTRLPDRPRRPRGRRGSHVAVDRHGWRRCGRHRDADQGAPHALLRPVVERAPNGTLTVYPGEGHYLDAVHDPEMLKFLTGRSWPTALKSPLPPPSNGRRGVVRATGGHQHELVDPGRWVASPGHTDRRSRRWSLRRRSMLNGTSRPGTCRPSAWRELPWPPGRRPTRHACKRASPRRLRTTTVMRGGCRRGGWRRRGRRRAWRGRRC